MFSYYNEDLPIYGYIDKKSKRKINERNILICGISIIVSFISGYLIGEYHCDKNILMDEI